MRCSKQLPIAILLLLCAAQCMASVNNNNYNEYWKKGNDFYQQKQYDSAAYYYEQIAVLKPINAEVYYNLGNTYYRLNRIPLAVLNYERSLKISPNNINAQDNLNIAQNRISNRIPKTNDIFFINWWRSLTNGQNATAWAAATLIAFVLIIASLWIRKFAKNGRKLPVQLPGILGFLCLCFLVIAFVSARNDENTNGAVVMENDAALMNGQQKGKPLALIPEGTTVKVLSENGMWIEVGLPDGRNGWLLQRQITKI